MAIEVTTGKQSSGDLIINFFNVEINHYGN